MLNDVRIPFYFHNLILFRGKQDIEKLNEKHVGKDFILAITNLIMKIHC